MDKYPELYGQNLDTGTDKHLSGSSVESFPYNSNNHCKKQGVIYILLH